MGVGSTHHHIHDADGPVRSPSATAGLALSAFLQQTNRKIARQPHAVAAPAPFGIRQSDSRESAVPSGPFVPFIRVDPLFLHGLFFLIR